MGDLGSIPGSGRSPGEGNGTHSSILAWRIPCTEEPGVLQSMESQRDTTKWLTLSLSLLYPTKIPLSSECSQWSQLRFMVYSLNWIPGWMRDHSREKGSEPCFLDHISVIWGSAPLTLFASHWDGDSHLGPLGMLMEALCGISGHLEDWNTSLSPFRIALPCSLCLLVALLLEYVRLCRC